VQEVIDKVPGLGDLPILGKVFRSRSTQKSADELLVVVTPHFVKPLSPEERAKLPDMPATFLPTVPEENKKHKNGRNNKSKAASPNDPQFVGPRGQQIPKQQ
jgi:pilus assembly protein CpaC